MADKKPETDKIVTLTVGAEDASWGRVIRETIESVAIAFILAFLFRTFEAEAFVIPTGSMAPKLQGRHKDVECPKCSYRYRAGASDEADREGSVIRDQTGALLCPVKSFMCPMCQYRVVLRTSQPRPNEKAPDNEVDPSLYPSYNGDRLLVSKFIYDLSPPRRWDVIVFKYPRDAKINYIKRLVGLPNETLQIIGGDIYVRDDAQQQAEFKLERKPAEKVLAMLQEVYDNDYVVPQAIEAGWPARWQAWTANPTADDWKAGDDEKSFIATGEGDGERWLRFQQFWSNSKDWSEIEKGKLTRRPAPELIKDFYAYNARDLAFECRTAGRKVGIEPENWVGDLAVDCVIKPQRAQGQVVLELIKAGRKHQCVLDLEAGTVRLAIVGEGEFQREAKGAFNGADKQHVIFANVDSQLLVWINDKQVDFGEATSYPPQRDSTPVERTPEPGVHVATDLSPVGVASRGAAVTIEHLRIRRDVYYTVNNVNVNTYATGADQYFMMGDNSPGSDDSRGWGTVDGRLLTGKALYIYWPHSFDEVTVFGSKIPFPFFPNFSRMGFVR